MKNTKMLRILALVCVLACAVLCIASCGKDKNGADTQATSDTINANGDYRVNLSGEIVDGKLLVTATIPENPGFAACSLNLKYDNTKIRPVKITNSEIVSTDSLTSNIQQSAPTVAELTSASVFFVNATDVTASGILFTMEFEILEGASGETELTLTSNVPGFVNENIEEVKFSLGEALKINLG